MAKGALRIRISRQAVARLASELAQFAEGQSKPVKLPSERDLAKKFGVGRRTIRLAVDLLEKQNLLARKHGSGNYLLPRKFALAAAYLIIPAELKVQDPFYSSLIGQLTLYARENQIQLIPVRLDGPVLFSKDLPGILLAKVPEERLAELASSVQSLIAMTDLNSDVCCQVFYDDFAVGQDACRQMAQFGHQHVLVLAGPQWQYTPARQRVEGFRAAAARMGMGYTVREGKMNWRSGYDLMAAYLREEGIKRMTGVFAANDWMAAGAMQAIIQAGLKVPGNLSLVGCDDVPLASELEPPLATFRLDIAQLVEQTFAGLEQSWRLQLPKKIVLGGKFVYRPSLGEVVERRE